MSDLSKQLVENGELTHPAVDADVNVIISDDKLKAYLNITPPEYDGKDVSSEMIIEELKKNKVTFGIIKEAIEKVDTYKSYCKDILVAEGIPAVNGNDGTYELLFDTSNEGRPKELEDGRVDFQNLDLIKNVKSGQLLCKIELPTNGEKGMSVFGKIIPAKNGKSVSTMTGKNTVLSDDGKEIYAAINGHVSFAVGKINVNDTLFIKEDVDNSTGNIITNSNVVVAGTVLPGFSVTSDGDVQIGGTVSGSFIKASGNVVLKNGIIGGKLECDGDLTTKFIENGDVFVRGSVKADYIMNSSIVCAKTINALGSISKIVGGTLVAGEDIKARVIGTASYTKTYLEIGTDPEVINRQQELIALIPDWESKIESLNSLLSLFRQLQKANRLTEDKKKMFLDAVYSYKTSTSLLEEGKQELEKINESLRKRGFGKIVCTGTIYPGTTVKIGDAKLVVKVPITNKSLYYTDDGICQAFAT